MIANLIADEAVGGQGKIGCLDRWRQDGYDASDTIMEAVMELKNKIWMNGNLEWIAYIGEEECFLGRREVPIPLDEGDAWINEMGDSYKVEDGEIKYLGRVEPPEKHW